MENNNIIIPWKPRVQQEEVLERFKRTVELKKKFFIVDAPTGVGKSLICMMLSEYFLTINENAKFDILTNTKQLQDQYKNDFSFVKEIKGKDNYTCYQAGVKMTCSEGSELNKAKGDKGCSNCSYVTAFNEYKNSKVGILNYALFFSYFVYAEDVITKRAANILFIDEAHLFEEGYAKFVNSFLSIGYLVSLDVQITPALTNNFENIKSKRDFANFLLTYVMPELKKKMDEILNSVKMTFIDINRKVSSLSKFRKISRTKCKFNRFINDEANWNDNWVFEKGTDDKGQIAYKVEVIWSTKYLKEIWDKYDHVVLLSGTILDKMLFSTILDIPKDNVVFTTIQSPFKANRRPIYFLPKGQMSHKILEESYKDILPYIVNILDKHKGQKGIIHTGNYKLSEWLKRDVKNSRLVFHNNTDREQQLQYHLLNESDTVIVSPSMINGVDLKDDLSRFQVILKIPYPALETQQIKMRMNQNKKWYAWKTLCDVIQSYGRSVRSETDWATTYILDSNFRFLIKNIPLPEYIQQSLIEISDLSEVKLLE